MELYDAGVVNLMHNADQSDPIRFRWKMEALACDELAALETSIGNTHFAIQFSSLGEPGLVVSKAGKVLKSVPASLRKNPAIKELKSRSQELAAQTKLMAGDLENMMVTQSELRTSEWQELRKHPALKEMLGALIFEISSEKSLLLLDDPQDGEDKILKIAHPLTASSFDEWHRLIKTLRAAKKKQPIPQIDRKTFKQLDCAGIRIMARKPLKEMGMRNWIYAPYEGLIRIFHAFQLQATICFDEKEDSWGQFESATLKKVELMDITDHTAIPMEKIDPILWSEILRDLDRLIELATV